MIDIDSQTSTNVSDLSSQTTYVKKMCCQGNIATRMCQKCLNKIHHDYSNPNNYYLVCNSYTCKCREYHRNSINLKNPCCLISLTDLTRQITWTIKNIDRQKYEADLKKFVYVFDEMISMTGFLKGDRKVLKKIRDTIVESILKKDITTYLDRSQKQFYNFLKGREIKQIKFPIYLEGSNNSLQSHYIFWKRSLFQQLTQMYFLSHNSDQDKKTQLAQLIEDINIHSKKQRVNQLKQKLAKLKLSLNFYNKSDANLYLNHVKQTSVPGYFCLTQVTGLTYSNFSKYNLTQFKLSNLEYLDVRQIREQIISLKFNLYPQLKQFKISFGPTNEYSLPNGRQFCYMIEDLLYKLAKNCHNLKTLKIENLWIEKRYLKTIGLMKQLTELDLDLNYVPIKYVGKYCLVLSKLENLKMNYTQQQFEGRSYFEQPQDYEEQEREYCNLQQSQQQKQKKQLKQPKTKVTKKQHESSIDVYIGRMETPKSRFTQLSQIESLTVLEISNTRLTSIELEQISTKLLNLRSLNISQNNLSNENLQLLASQLGNLQHLNIKLCNIDDEKLKTISKGVFELKSINLERNDVGNKGLQYLIKNQLYLESLNIKAQYHQSYQQNGYKQLSFQHFIEMSYNLLYLKILQFSLGNFKEKGESYFFYISKIKSLTEFQTQQKVFLLQTFENYLEVMERYQFKVINNSNLFIEKYKFDILNNDMKSKKSPHVFRRTMRNVKLLNDIKNSKV